MSTRTPETYTLDEAIAEIRRLRAEVERLDGQLQQTRSAGQSPSETIEAGPPELRALEGFAQLIAAARTPGPRREGGRTVPFIPPGRRIAGEALEVFPPAATTAAGRLTPPPSARQVIDVRESRSSRDSGAREKDITFDTPVDSRHSPFGGLESGSTVRNDAGSRLAASGEEAVNRHLAEMRATINRIRENLRLGPSRYPPTSEGPAIDAPVSVDVEAPIRDVAVSQTPRQPPPEVPSSASLSIDSAVATRIDPELPAVLPPAAEVVPLGDAERVEVQHLVDLQGPGQAHDQTGKKGDITAAAPAGESAREPIAYVSNQPIAWPPPPESLDVPVAVSAAAPASDAIDSHEAPASRRRALVGVAAVLALAAVAVWYWARPAQPVGQAAPPASATPPSAAQTPTAAQPVPAAPDSTPAVDTAASAPPAENATTPPTDSAAAPSAPAGPGQLRLTTSREVWLFVVVDGRTVLESLAPAGRTFTFTMSRDASVRAGDAGAVEVSVGGTPSSPLGADGSVLTRRFSVPGAPALAGDGSPPAQPPQ